MAASLLAYFKTTIFKYVICVGERETGPDKLIRIFSPQMVPFGK